MSDIAGAGRPPRAQQPRQNTPLQATLPAGTGLGDTRSPKTYTRRPPPAPAARQRRPSAPHNTSLACPPRPRFRRASGPRCPPEPRLRRAPGEARRPGRPGPVTAAEIHKSPTHNSLSDPKLLAPPRGQSACGAADGSTPSPQAARRRRHGHTHPLPHVRHLFGLILPRPAQPKHTC